MQIITKNLTHIYGDDSTSKITGISNVSISIDRGEFLGIMGHTGSGKTTLVQHFNGLLLPTAGDVLVDGVNTKTHPLPRSVRYGVGFVFQYPEDQLFSETVYDEVAFGPRNMKIDEVEIKSRVNHCLNLVGLAEINILKSSPFHLSGGQQRRLVIASVLAMNPSVMILDEPTAGLDPGGRKLIMDVIKNLHDSLNLTVVLVSHDIETIAEYVKRVIIMSKGSVAADGVANDVLWDIEALFDLGLEPPQIVQLMSSLIDRGFICKCRATTVDEAAKDIVRAIRG